jgi:enamine deaminase RidA (YjgF/YER057c/UK114 family)
MKSLYLRELSHSTRIPSGKLAGGWLFSSLINGSDPITRTLPSSLEEQAANMFDKVGLLLRAAGGTVDQVVKVTLWLRDRSDRVCIEQEWKRTFPDEAIQPARVALNRDLGGNKLIECEFTALIG